MRVLPLALLATIVLTPVVTGQGHDHGNQGPTLLTHDGPADGRQFVGNLAHFAAIAHGTDAIPDFHQDIPMRVTLNGRVLFESTTDSGHDYDGINIIDVVFPEAGAYVVEALGPDGGVVASFPGEVVEAPQGAAQALALVAGSTEPLAGQPVDFTFYVHAPGTDTPTPHTDCWFEAVRDGRTQFRTKTHTHEEQQALSYAFPEAGAYLVRVTCFQAYPSLKATLFAPVVAQVEIQVQPGLPAGGLAVDDGAQATPPADLNAVVLGVDGGKLRLVGTYDPYTVVGTGTPQHLTVAAVDPATGAPRQHVDFEVTLEGPTGRQFQSVTLHEYDGLYELAVRQSLPGVYTLRVTADAGDWKDTIEMAYTVVAPVAPTSAGVVSFNLGYHGANEGTVGDYELGAQATSGPFAHSEVELRVVGSSSRVPLLVTKLHTHDDGAFPFRLSLPQDDYVFEVDGFPLMPEAVLVEADTFAVPIGPPLGTDEAGVTESPQDAPSLTFLVTLAALGAVLAMARRR